VDEKVKVTNSSGDILLHLDGTTSGIGSIGIGTTGTTFRVDPNNTVTFPGNIISSGIITAASFSGPISGSTGTFTSNVTIDGNLGVGGVITYEDVARVDAVGLSTFREGFGVGPLSGIALTAYKDGSIRTSGIVTASSFVGSGANLTGLPASSEWSFQTTGITTTKNVGIATDSVIHTDLVGAGNSFVGAYIGDGFLAFNKNLNRSGGYYITTDINALNAGPVTLGSTMTLDGTWVIV
jgi:hypothetical protein